MKRLYLLLFILSLLLFSQQPGRVIGADDEDGPNLQIPKDFPEKGKESLLEGLKLFKELKSGGGANTGYVLPSLRLKKAEQAEKKCEKAIKCFQKAGKAAPKSHLPPFYPTIMDRTLPCIPPHLPEDNRWRCSLLPLPSQYNPRDL